MLFILAGFRVHRWRLTFQDPWSDLCCLGTFTATLCSRSRQEARYDGLSEDRVRDVNLELWLSWQEAAKKITAQKKREEKAALDGGFSKQGG